MNSTIGGATLANLTQFLKCVVIHHLFNFSIALYPGKGWNCVSAMPSTMQSSASESHSDLSSSGTILLLLACMTHTTHVSMTVCLDSYLSWWCTIMMSKSVTIVCPDLQNSFFVDFGADSQSIYCLIWWGKWRFRHHSSAQGGRSPIHDNRSTSDPGVQEAVPLSACVFSVTVDLLGTSHFGIGYMDRCIADESKAVIRVFHIIVHGDIFSILRRGNLER